MALSTQTPTPKPSLDHLILFLPCAPNSPAPLLPPFFTTHFTITPGGTHADNLTANSLIILSDGCYMELICFLPSAPSPFIASHWWGPDVQRKGWTDWCLTTSDSPDTNYARLKKTGESHAEPIQGARKRPDGVEVKWAVTFPAGSNGGQESRGKVPFFCHDVTARELRVPITEASTGHACGALGVRELTVVVGSRESFEEMRTVYGGLFGGDGIKRGDEVVFEVGRVREAEGLDREARIVLRMPKDETETDKVKEKGFWFGNVVLAAKAGEGKQAGQREKIDGGEDDVGGLWVEYV